MKINKEKLIEILKEIAKERGDDSQVSIGVPKQKQKLKDIIFALENEKINNEKNPRHYYHLCVFACNFYAEQPENKYMDVRINKILNTGELVLNYPELEIGDIKELIKEKLFDLPKEN